ncbi:hypothetical protein C5613_29570 [Rhodococcus opacus]|uniref:Uncharacterized protein n=1 Tax=Rhodococcus opacus TaxID=37919 RepID=A0A2S8IYB6_RHOOP|nr:hypothetical protein C5613_29570 [Rhodococcus opacus]
MASSAPSIWLIRAMRLLQSTSHRPPHVITDSVDSLVAVRGRIAVTACADSSSNAISGSPRSGVGCWQSRSRGWGFGIALPDAATKAKVAGFAAAWGALCAYSGRPTG